MGNPGDRGGQTAGRMDKFSMMLIPNFNNSFVDSLQLFAHKRGLPARRPAGLDSQQS